MMDNTMIDLIIAVAVALWTLFQEIRHRRNRGGSLTAWHKNSPQRNDDNAPQY